MKTGFELDVKSFILSNTFSDQKIDITGQYYDLPQYDLGKYDRRFALIDFRVENELISKNPEFHMEYLRRLGKLKKMGFTFVQSAPWEQPQLGRNNTKFFPNTTVVNRHEWWGDASWWWWFCARKHRGTEFNFDHREKKFDFLYLNKLKKRHRETLWYKLREGDLLSKSLITFHGLEPQHKLPPEYELPWVDRNNYPKIGFDQDVYEKPYNDCAVSIVSESDVTGLFITEKVYKPLMAGQIFVVQGFHGILAKLRSMGFETFGEHIDESYDEEPDHDKRCDMIRSTLEKIKQLDYKELYANTEKVRTHNQKVFFDKDILGEEINRTLRLWFEFADRGQISS